MEPNAGLDPETPGSCPEPKADAQPLSSQASQINLKKKKKKKEGGPGGPAVWRRLRPGV